MMHTQMAKLYQLAADPKGAYGEIHGYEAGVFTEQRLNSYAAIVSFLFKSPLSAEQVAAVKTALLPFKVVPEIRQEGAVLLIPFFAPFFTAKVQERTDQVLRAATDAFVAVGAVQHAGCALCEQEGFDRLRLIRGLAMKTHDACHQKLMADVQAAYRKIDTSTTNLVKGYLWAIAGALVGAVVNLLVLIFSGYQFALLYALVPGAAMFMYKAAKAPLRKEIPFVLSILSVIVSAMMMLGVYQLIATGYETTLSVLLSGGVADWPEAGETFTSDILIAVLFSALGVLFLSRYIFKPRA